MHVFLTFCAVFIWIYNLISLFLLYVRGRQPGKKLRKIVGGCRICRQRTFLSSPICRQRTLLSSPIYRQRKLPLSFISDTTWTSLLTYSTFADKLNVKGGGCGTATPLSATIDTHELFKPGFE